MPVIRPSTRWQGILPREALLERLDQELRGAGPPAGPVVFECPVKVNRTWHVIVVWQDWAGVPDDDRSSIIHEAYARSEKVDLPEESKASSITIAIGVTPEEASASDLLPYSLSPAISRDDPAYDEVLRAMIEAGAVEFPTGPELRFPDRRMAEEARDRLQRKRFAVAQVPFWQIGETVSHIHD